MRRAGCRCDDLYAAKGFSGRLLEQVVDTITANRERWLARMPALVVAIVLSAVVLFGVGVYSAVTLVGDWRKSGLRMLAIGLGAAGIGFLIGHLFHTAGA